jgi:parvulin-like peptidyl-prolyl isomerase
LKRSAALYLACALAVGCTENHAPSSDSDAGTRVASAGGSRNLPVAPTSQPAQVIATVNGKPIEREQLIKPLVEAYGLNVLLQLIQLELARQDAAKAGVVVSPADVEAERNNILKGAFPEADPKDYDQLLENLLKQQNITRPQFDIVIQTNATLRKMAEPMAAGKISDENVKQAFDVMYGATVKIRDIQVSNMTDAQEVRKRAAAGEDFAALAKKFSKDVRTRDVGGEWPAFSRNSTGVSEAIKDQAFALKDGEVSDAIDTEGAVHVIKVEKHNAPKIAKLDEPTKASLRKLLSEKLVQETMKSLRNRIAIEAQQANVLEIKDPVLAHQFQGKLAEHQAQAQQDLEEARRQQMRDAIGLPSTRPATNPAGSEARERPPATRSGR